MPKDPQSIEYGQWWVKIIASIQAKANNVPTNCCENVTYLKRRSWMFGVISPRELANILMTNRNFKGVRAWISGQFVNLFSNVKLYN
jgi:hypothetical protein